MVGHVGAFVDRGRTAADNGRSYPEMKHHRQPAIYLRPLAAGLGLRIPTTGLRRDFVAIASRVALGCLVLAAAGCTPKLQPIFEEPIPPITWPPAPAPPRIRYVGQLRSSEDLKPPRNAFQAIGEFFVGAEAPKPLYGPRSVVGTADGRRLWIADPGGRCLHVLDLDDRSYQKIRKAGSAALLSPVDVCLGPEDVIYVCDSESIDVYQFSAVTGGFLGSLRLPEEIGRPAAVGFDANAQELYVVDVSRHDIKVLDREGRLLRILGRRGLAPGEFNFPSDVVVDGGVIWVVDTGNQRVQSLTPTGEPIATFAQAGDAPGDLALPKGIAFDSDGHAYVVDARFENVQIFDRSGRLLLMFGGEGDGPGEFWLPAGIFIDGQDRIWVCDTYNARVQVFQYVPEAPVSELPDRSPEGRVASENPSL
jgi:sugar lactone lactonase YvrE